MVVDNKLYGWVVEKLNFEPGLDETNITVSIKDEGIVVLGGYVRSYVEKRLAEKAIERIENVRGVANEITVDLLASYKRNDAEIVKAALHALEWNLLIPHKDIKVAVDNGHLTLSGKVSYNYQRDRAQKAVSDLYGVTYVTNNIEIKPEIKPEDVKNKIISEFERNARIDANNVKVEVDGDKVILKGKVKNFDEAREARQAAWSIPGIASVVDNMTINW